MYRMSMDILPILKPGRIIAAIGISSFLPALLAELACHGPVTVLDGGNRFPAYRIAREIRKRSLNVKEASDRLFLRRAFTAYQVVHLLESASPCPHPQVLLDPLAAFQDDQITPREAGRLLSICLNHLQRLALSAPVALCLEAHIIIEKAFLLKRLSDQSDEVFVSADISPPHASQLPLFT